MAANKQQGQWFGLFLAGLTAACAGLAGFSSGLGKGAPAGRRGTGRIFVEISQDQAAGGKGRTRFSAGSHETGRRCRDASRMGVVLFGLHLTPSVGGQMIVALIGLMAITLIGVIFILPAACNKNAIWKA